MKNMEDPNVSPVFVLSRLLSRDVLGIIRSYLKNPIKLLQRFVRQYYFRYPILTNEFYKSVVQSMSVRLPPLTLVRFSSMGTPAWCCPYKQGFIEFFGERYSRDMLYKTLYRLKKKAYNHLI